MLEVVGNGCKSELVVVYELVALIIKFIPLAANSI